MKKITLKLIIISLMCSLVNCATSFVKISDNYTDKYIDGKLLAISLDDNKIDVNYSGNVEPEFGPGNPHQLIKSFFKSELIADIKEKTNFEDVVIKKKHKKVSLRDEQVKTKDGIDYVAVPVHGTCIYNDSKDFNYVLILNEVFIGTALNTTYRAPFMGANGMMIGGGTSTKKVLSYKAKFVLWDNVKKEEVAYGKISATSSSKFIAVIRMYNWTNVSNSFVSKIFRDTPFYNTIE